MALYTTAGFTNGTQKSLQVKGKKIHKVEKILKGILDSIPPPSTSKKIQIMVGKFACGVMAKRCTF